MKKNQSITVDYDVISNIDIDEKFEFTCYQCGGCCTDRDDIVLSAYDVYKASKELNMHPCEFINKYCYTYISAESYMVRVQFKPQGRKMRCPMLKNKKCIIQKAKPSICAMFPVGRVFTTKKCDETGTEKDAIEYLFCQHDCGVDDTHTVREWFESYGIPVDDPIFIEWQKTISAVSEFAKDVKDAISEINARGELQDILLYLFINYDTSEEFIPQLQRNMEDVIDTLKEIKVVLSKDR